MGSCSPYIRDTMTGILKYIGDAIKPPVATQADIDLAYFKRNFDRLTGHHGRSAPPVHKRNSPHRGTDAAYYSLYFQGHRIDRIEY